MEDRRCKLGLQGRLELVLLIEQGAPVVASLGAGQRCRTRVTIVSGDPLAAAAVVPVGAEQR